MNESTLLFTQGWDSLETVIAAESLALILQSSGSLNEAKELLQRFIFLSIFYNFKQIHKCENLFLRILIFFLCFRCLVSRRKLLPEGHIQVLIMLYNVHFFIFLNHKKKIH